MSAAFTFAPIAPRTKTPRSRCGCETWQQAYPEIDFAARVAWWRERWRNELVPNAAIIVAEQDGALIGFVTIDAIGLSRPARGRPRSTGARSSATALVDEAKRLLARPHHAAGQHRQRPRHPLLRAQRLCACRRDVNPTSGRPVLRMEWKA